MNLDRQTKEEALEAFEYRYPVAGETVHALIDTYGGVDEFIHTLEQKGFDRELHGWVTARKPACMPMEQIRSLIPHEKFEAVSKKTGTNVESVELQCAQYLPRFFRTMAEDIDGMGFLWEHHPSHSTQNKSTHH
jgi:hypothetical protein